MRCPECGSGNVYCYLSRQRKKWRLRRYKCAECGGKFTTEERIRSANNNAGTKEEGENNEAPTAE